MSQPIQLRAFMDRIVRLCRRQKREFREIHSELGLGVAFHLPGGWQVHIIALRTGMMIVSTLPVVVPPERRAVVADLLNRVNYISVGGMLSMCPEDGQVRLRHCLVTSPECISSTIVLDMLRANCGATRHSIVKLQEFLREPTSAESASEDWTTPIGETPGSDDPPPNPQSQHKAPRSPHSRFNPN